MERDEGARGLGGPQGGPHRLDAEGHTVAVGSIFSKATGSDLAVTRLR